MAQFSAAGLETIPIRTKRLAAEKAERDRLFAIAEAKRIAAEKKAAEEKAFKALQDKYVAAGQSKFYAELYQVPKRRQTPSGMSMHKWNRMRGAAEAAAVKRSAGGSVGAYIGAREKGFTKALARSYAYAVSRITPIAKRRYPAGSGQGLMDMQRAKLNVINQRFGLAPAPRTLVYRGLA